MTHIDHHTETVHLANHLGSKVAHSVMGVITSCTVTDVIVAIMTKGDIHHSPIGKMPYIGNVAFECKPVLYSEHNRLLSVMLVFPQLSRSAGKSKILTVFGYNILYFVEYQISIFLWTINVEAHVLTESLIFLWLWKISHHYSGILTSVGHLVQIDKQLGIATVEAHTIGKEHRCVAVGVKREDAVVHIACGMIVSCLGNEPLKQGQSVVDTFRMPLHTDDRFHLGALHSLNNSVTGSGYNTEFITRFAYGLMVEGVDIQCT